MSKAIKLGIVGVLVLLGLASVLTVKHLRAAESVRTIDDHDPRGYVAKFKYTLVPNKTEAVADGSDTISFTFGAFYITPFPAGCTDEACSGKDVVYYPCSQGASEANPKPLCMVHEYNNGCDTPNLNDPPLSAVSIDMTDDFSAAAGLNQVVPDQFIKNDVTVIPVSSFSCQNGLATFQIKSTTPGQKRIAYASRSVDYMGQYHGTSYRGISGWNIFLSSVITFTPAASTTTQATGTTNKNTNTSTGSVVKKAATFTANQNIALATINDKGVADLETNAITTDDTIALKGTAKANSTVNITIHSDAQYTKSAKADASGNWIANIDQKLAAGLHTINAEVIDNGKSLGSSQIAQFYVVEKAEAIVSETASDVNPVTTTATTTKTNKYTDFLKSNWIELVLVGIAVILVIILIVIRKKQAKISI